MIINKNRLLNIVFHVWFIMVIILSVIPKTPKSRVVVWGLDFRMDYIEHLVVYFVLGLLYVKSNRGIVSKKGIIKVLYILMWIAFAVATELVQKFIGGRTFNPNDMYYNTAGIVLGLVITMACLGKMKKTMAQENVLSG
ncbi:MAG: VanZ family protein [Bacteroidales bacterium]|nr:VanZ family protein [Bacteroidales bacterium]